MPRSSRILTSNGDFALRYDNESVVEKIDAGDDAQQMRLAEFVMRTIDNDSQGVTVQSAMKDLKLQNKQDVLPGMEVRLLPHQVIGVSWMVKQERESPHKGGILADDMGLGKTIQMIATMALNMPDEDETSRTTLVVVPAALLLQWKEEIEQKTNGIFSVHIHHGKDKLKKLSQMRNKDIIITTYQTLTNEFAAPHSLHPDEVEEWVTKNGGLLARMRWYRVVVDEAQFIRNRATRASKAVAMLRTRYRWCLTGTPVTNTLADIYGLLRFGHFRPFNVWNDFNEYVAKVQLKDAPMAGMRAQQIMKPITLRRTKNSELDGKPLLQLPEKHVDFVELEFSKDEQELYDSIQRRAQIQINRYLRSGTVLKNTSAVLVLILRLRQLCIHPSLVLSLSEDDDPNSAAANAADKEYQRASKAMGMRWAFGIKRAFLERAKQALIEFEEDDDLEPPAGECPVCGDPFVNDNGLVLACGHEMCFDCCRETAQAPIAHNGVFGYDDEEKNLQVEKEFEEAAAKGLRPCPTCKKMNDLRPSTVFKASAFQPTRDELLSALRRRRPGLMPRASGSSSSQPGVQGKKPSFDTIDLPDSDDSSDDELPDLSAMMKLSASEFKAKGLTAPKTEVAKRVASPKVDDETITDITLKDLTAPKGKRSAASGAEPSRALIETWRQGGANAEPSAKMLALVGLLQEWESTGDKTICFSQWTSVLDIVENLFARNGIQSLRYDGTMSRETREAVLARFKHHGGPRVILVSIKCGGVGLNLTAANRIINLDLSWNYASESQAYDRVHRLGQEKEVFVKRLIVKNTIEERMLRLQDTKTGLAEAALGEGAGGRLHKLSVKELKDLFGMSKNNDEDPNQPRLQF